MATFLGSDTFCLTDLALIDLQVTDPRVLIAQRIARRWQTPRGALALINDDPNFGWDITQYVNARITPAFVNQAQSQLAAEALKDEQVASASVQMTLSGTTLTVKGLFTTASGPFTLTLNVADLTVSAIFSFGISP